MLWRHSLRKNFGCNYSTNHFSVPLLDVSPYTAPGTDAFGSVPTQSQAKVAEELRRACTEELGFYSIVGHHVKQTLIDDVWGVSQLYFNQPSVSRKDDAVESHEPYGYMPYASESLAQSLGEEMPADLKESLSIGPVFDRHGWRGTSRFRPDEANAASAFAFQENKWPRDEENLRYGLCDYFIEMDHLAAK